MNNSTPNPLHGPCIRVTLATAWSTIIDWLTGKYGQETGESRILFIDDGNDCAILGCALS